MCNSQPFVLLPYILRIQIEPRIEKQSEPPRSNLSQDSIKPHHTGAQREFSSQSESKTASAGPVS